MWYCLCPSLLSNIYEMTLQHFTTLSKHKQYRNLIVNAVCVADRCTDDACVLLFQVKGFYVEVFFTKDGDEILSSRNFENTDDLQPYLEQIDIVRLVNG